MKEILVELHDWRNLTGQQQMDLYPFSVHRQVKTERGIEGCMVARCNSMDEAVQVAESLLKGSVYLFGFKGAGAFGFVVFEGGQPVATVGHSGRDNSDLFGGLSERGE